MGTRLGDVERGRGGPADPCDILGFEGVDEFPAVFFSDEAEEVEHGVVVIGVWEDYFVGPFVGEVVGVELRQVGFLVYGGVVKCGPKIDWRGNDIIICSQQRSTRKEKGDLQIKYPAYAPSLSTNSGCISFQLAGL